MDKNKDQFDKEVNINSKNDEDSTEDGLFFYVMTLQTENGEKHQIKIYENSNASELAFNFCKEYNLDYPTMKYLKKSIKQIIQQFQNTKKNEMIYLFKDNNSIQEVAEEEIITDNSLKKSGTFKKSSQNKKSRITLEDEEEKNSKNNCSKENNKNINNVENNGNKNKDINTNKENEENLKEKKFENCNNNDVNQLNNKKIEKNIIKNLILNENENNDYVVVKSRNNIIEEDEQIEQKDFSIDYCLDNDSLQIFSPTEHTTKIEQRSSIKNSSCLTKKKYDSKIFKSQNFQLYSNKSYLKQNYFFNFNKLKIEKYKNNDNNIHHKKIIFTKKNSSNNNYINKKKPLSVEKNKKKTNNRSPILELSQNYKKSDIMKQTKHSIYKNKYEKFISGMNYMKNKYFSSYYNYFIKSKNICKNKTFSINSISQKFHTNSSINQDSNKSKSISNSKIKKNMAPQTLSRNKINKKKKEKEKSMMQLNTFNFQKLNNSSKVNLNTILKKDSHTKDKHRTVFKNKVKSKYNITYNNIISKTINKRNSSFKKKKGTNGKELFVETKRHNCYGIKKMVVDSLLNIHKLTDNHDNKKKSLITSRVIKGLQARKKINKNKELFNKLFRNESNIEKSNKVYDKLHIDLRGVHNNTNNNINYNNTILKSKRNNTDNNYIKNKNNIKIEHKGRLLTSNKQN